MTATFAAFVSIYPEAKMFEIAGAERLFNRLSPAERGDAIAAAALLSDELRRYKRRPSSPLRWLARRSWAEFTGVELAAGRERLRRLGIGGVEPPVVEGKTCHCNVEVASAVSSVGAADTENKAENSVLLKNVDRITVQLGGRTLELLAQGDLGFQGEIVIVNHSKSPSVGFAPPMVAGPGVELPASGPRESEALRQARAL